MLRRAENSPPSTHVGDVEGDRGRVLGGRHQLGGDDVRLHRAGLVDQEHARLAAAAWPLRDAPAPTARAGGSSRRGASRAAAPARRGWCRRPPPGWRLVGPQPRLVERHQVVAVSDGDGGLGAAAGEGAWRTGGRRRTGAAAARAGRCELRARLLLLDAGDPGGAHALDLGVCRSAAAAARRRYSASDGSRLTAQRRQGRRCAVERAPAPRLRAQRLDAVGERRARPACRRPRRACPSRSWRCRACRRVGA
jgi:hypothetical protein